MTYNLSKTNKKWVYIGIKTKQVDDNLDRIFKNKVYSTEEQKKRDFNKPIKISNVKSKLIKR